ncbi:hypothetical protein [Heliophilum fasciatum]|uniref:LITAF domain-containing protein n=1 Tax=Heliophilum fasciatum TaxID=35700 RepID=A0A4V2SW65_9FIRM|nr:hypothetical protein [Heliophilum fasciatum]MCW2279178.1 DNA-directed RNA polymerase subunit RPC12/RpoP [Heliophilum fasciatum]TCP61036.1 hypothetical protein EDD73_13133 [Heliophilum fasciatum]
MNEIDFALSKEFREFITHNEKPWELTWVPCPRCGSKRVIFNAKTEGVMFVLKSFLWVILILVTGVIPGLIYYAWYFRVNPFLTRDFLCRDCRLQWIKEDMMPS